jgi:hypothetical protein
MKKGEKGHTVHRKIMIEQHKPHWKQEVKSGAPER